eukprot:TRINITY_DN4419_c0_g1_i2.p1 TRINITY_DN4419_c0_g1~~TRINITY_DN4419_c0_g1_i2.p1  ORF type:complete len:615 (+),score=106.70 TRINITY_DN4419_c0_g1_i2:76-1920(+)
MSDGVDRVCSSQHLKERDELRRNVKFSERRFDVETLPADIQRVYRSIKARYDEEYALLFVFNMQTAMEMHRAWNLTLSTSHTLQKCADTLGLRMYWDLGVIRLKFFMEDGNFELQRKCPYDYDSEFQDLFMKMASAVYHGHLTVNEALIWQDEAKKGKHTSRAGWVFRYWPGRIPLVPAMSASCAVIFFGGDELDAAVAAICGTVAGFVSYGLGLIGGDAGKLEDFFVGTFTGMIGGLFFRFHSDQYCLSSIFLGTMYWYFYGTAFVVGLMEILAGELETGVTRFMAVSIKTFVLCLMACLGMLLVLDNPTEVWEAQMQNCGTIDLSTKWWRIPLYLGNCASVLGQYRFPITEWWRGLAVMLVGYEVQFQVSYAIQQRNHTTKDNLDVMASNIMGSCCSVLMACLLSYMVDFVNKRYYSQLLQRGRNRDETPGLFDDCLYGFLSCFVKIFNVVGLGRKADAEEVALEKKLHEQMKEVKDQHHSRQEIVLEPHEEDLLLDTIVFAEPMNIWSMLMPAIYQLVPGSMIARLWFESIIPPSEYNSKDNMFAGLMVTSISLAVGTIIGNAIVMTLVKVFTKIGLRAPPRKELKMQHRSNTEKVESKQSNEKYAKEMEI